MTPTYVEPKQREAHARRITAQLRAFDPAPATPGDDAPAILWALVAASIACLLGMALAWFAM